MSMRRFRVAEDSMLPTLTPGVEFVASDTRGPRTGEIVALPHPERADFWLVKRLVAGPGDEIAGLVLGIDEAWVLSDNLEATRADSRTLGPVSYRSLWAVVGRLDQATFTDGVAMLADEDAALGGIIEQWGMPGFWERDPGLPTLVLLVLEQQVSLESGAAMYRRLVDLIGPVTGAGLLEAGEIGLTSIGVTRQKAGYLVAMAQAVTEGHLDFDRLGQLEEGAARSALLALRGVGAWTADAYLLSALRLPDVLPVGDRALQVGVAEAMGLASPPTPDELELLAEPWRPVRAVAARIVWHGYLASRGRVEPTVTPP